MCLLIYWEKHPLATMLPLESSLLELIRIKNMCCRWFKTHLGCIVYSARLSGVDGWHCIVHIHWVCTSGEEMKPKTNICDIARTECRGSDFPKFINIIAPKLVPFRPDFFKTDGMKILMTAYNYL